jgi:hypothetical protein
MFFERTTKATTNPIQETICRYSECRVAIKPTNNCVAI